MWQTIIVQWCNSIAGSIALLALIVIALGTMVGLIKPGEVMQSVGLVIGIVIASILLVSVFVGLWSSMSVWQKLVSAALVANVFRLRQMRRQVRKGREDD